MKEDALSNKLKYLDVLCFPTLYPTGKFGECHPRQQKILPSKFVKSCLMNKDGRFRKDDQYVFISSGKRRCGSLQVVCSTCSRAPDSMQSLSGSLLIGCPRTRRKLRPTCPWCSRTCVAQTNTGTYIVVKFSAWWQSTGLQLYSSPSAVQSTTGLKWPPALGKWTMWVTATQLGSCVQRIPSLCPENSHRHFTISSTL